MKVKTLSVTKSKTLYASLSILALGSHLFGTTALAASWNPEYLWDGSMVTPTTLRCAVDNLDPEGARGRTLWSLKPAQAEHTLNFFTFLTEGHTDYIAAFGSTEQAKQELLNSWMYYSSGRPKARPQYPLWALDGERESSVTTLSWRAPTTEDAPDLNGETARIRAVCTSSCYKPEVRVFFPDGYESIEDAFHNNTPQIVTLSEDAKLDNLQYVVSPVESYTREVKPALHEIIRLETQDGGRLLVTPNHPLLDDSGVMREARTFKTGEALVRTNGKPAVLKTVSPESHFGQVYNVTPKSNNLRSHVVVAEGFLSGSAWYQNDGAIALNRDIFRFNLPTGILE